MQSRNLICSRQHRYEVQTFRCSFLCFYTFFSWVPLDFFTNKGHLFSTLITVISPAGRHRQPTGVLHLRSCRVMYIIPSWCGFELQPTSSQSAVTGGSLLAAESFQPLHQDIWPLRTIFINNNNNKCVNSWTCTCVSSLSLSPSLSYSCPILSECLLLSHVQL